MRTYKEQTALILDKVNKHNSAKKKRVKYISSVSIAACLSLFVICGTAFAVSEEFREFVISFFKSEQIEEPITSSKPTTSTEPNQSDKQTHFLGKQEIDGIAEVSYYRFNSYFDVYDNTLATRAEDGQFNIFKLEDNELIELTQYRIEDTIHIYGHDIPLGFVYVIDDGRIKTFDNFHMPATDEDAIAVWSAEGDFVWVSISMRGEFSTYVRYNLKTGAVQDIIGEAGIEIDINTQISLSPDESTILVYNLHTVYLIDVDKATARELTSINTPDELSVGFIDNDTLSVWQWSDEEDVRFTVFSYSISNDEKTVIFENMPSYSPYSGTSTGIRGLGKGILILVEQERYTVVDVKNGIRYTVDELTPDSSIDFLLSPDRKRISVVTTSGQNGLGITQIGCINIEKQELKVFDRQDFSGNYETSMYWMSGNELAVTASNEKQFLYVYRFD